MKTVTAYIKPHKLSDVTLALHQIEKLSGASISEVRGFGRGRAKDVSDSVVYDTLEYLISIRVDIACSDELVEQIVSTIESSAHTGLRGDGKIFVHSLEHAVRISTGERDHAAI